MGIRNQRTTHPRKAKRRAVALENFSVARRRVDDKDYMGRKLAEYIALGGKPEQMQFVPQRLGKAA